MHVFITGASGFIGKAVVKELLSAGHTVLGLARTDKAADELVTLGATVKRGSLQDLNALKEGAAASDGEFASFYSTFQHSSSKLIRNVKTRCHPSSLCPRLRQLR